MADLEKLLLEAAGRTSGSGRKRPSPASRRQRNGPYSDDGTDSKDDDSDDGSGYASRKPSGPQVPLKKRLDPSERDDDQSSHDEGDDEARYDRDTDSGDEIYDNDHYKDEHDRQRLAKMSELEREMILSERADKVNNKKMREDMKSKKIEKTPQFGKGGTHISSSAGLRSSSRSAGTKKPSLIQLRARIEQKQQDSGVVKKPEPGKGNSGSGENSQSKWRSNRITSPSNLSKSDSDSGSEDDDSTGDGRMVDSDGEKMLSESKVPTYEDIKEITIRRSKLAKWFMEPFFDELIIGCFVRVGIGKSRTGPIYRLCMVRNVDASEPDRQYKLENKMTYKYLNVVWGNESSAARWQMAMISDSPPVREEFDQWVREVERNGGRMPSKQDVSEKKESIQKTNTFVYNADTVKQMLHDKKAATWRPLNIAAEKDRLRRELEVAKSKNDDTEVARINARLQELQASRKPQQKDFKALRLAEMNKKNRFENFKNASEMKPVNTSLKAGEDGYDPFSRRWTRSKNYYVSKDVNEVEGEEENSDDALDEALTTAAALEAAADAGKLVDTSAPVELGGTEFNMLHNFDLPISLATLQKLGGPQGAQAGFMARKQRIEATIGVKVPENDGRRHALTLSVSDYKRRMGLL
ncbi:protein RTF1 homolog [Impatiens glandulifera]|uniref:protein RTF1 homolog n=1 Tax=Impatiens glandulifera TaxID=253017 RepID=UPI001FB06D11|nr:protein RTF1 homolog [Impatiens glandulifera]